MTACCCRLTHPANSKKKKASGGGSGSIAEACPDARPRFKGHLDWAEFPDRTPAPVALIPPLYWVIRRRRNFRTGRGRSDNGPAEPEPASVASRLSLLT